MSDVVEKVTKLVALSASPNEFEAANAAVLACRLMREHGLRVAGETPAPSFGNGFAERDFGAELEQIMRETAARRAAEEALPPYERARVRCAHLHMGRRESLTIAARIAVDCGLSDSEIVALVHDLQGTAMVQWTDAEIAWAIRCERRATVTPASSRVSP